MALLSFLVTVLMIPVFPEGGTEPRWSLLFIVVPLLFAQRYFEKPSLTDVLGIVFLGWCGSTLFWSSDPYEGSIFYFRFLIIGMLFCIGSTRESLRPVYTGMAFGLLINSAVIVLQINGLTVLPQVAAPAGLFINKNFSGELAALVIVGLIGERLWWLLPGVIPSLLLPVARAPFLAITVAGTLWLWTKSRMAAVLVGIVGCSAGVFVYHLRTYNDTLTQRWHVWVDTVGSLTLFGHGFGSFFSAYPQFQTHDATHIIFEHPHNDLLQILFESGWVGGLVFIAFLVSVLRGRWKAPEVYVLLAFLVEGCFGFPLYNPATAFVGALVAGHLNCGRDVLCWDELRGKLRVLARVAADGGLRLRSRAFWKRREDLSL